VNFTGPTDNVPLCFHQPIKLHVSLKATHSDPGTSRCSCVGHFEWPIALLEFIVANEFDLLTLLSWTSKDPLWWLTAVKNMTLGYDLNFRVCDLLKYTVRADWWKISEKEQHHWSTVFTCFTITEFYKGGDIAQRSDNCCFVILQYFTENINETKKWTP